MEMMQKDWTAERVAEAALDAVARGVKVVISVGDSTYTFNAEAAEQG